MNPEILKKEIAELTSKEQLCYKMLAQIRSRKEKLILFLYEQENVDFNNLACVELSDRTPESNLSLESINRQNNEYSASVLEAVADLIVNQIAKMQLWSFGVAYMAEVLNQEVDVVKHSLRLQGYEQFWQPSKSQTSITDESTKTWIANLDLINQVQEAFAQTSEPLALDKNETAESAMTSQFPEKKQKSFKRSLPPNSTDDLVEKSSSVMDLLNRVFDSNRSEQLDAAGILDYLYPGQTKYWSKEERRFRVQLVSRELCTSIKKGNWRRISVGVYSHA